MYFVKNNVLNLHEIPCNFVCKSTVFLWIRYQAPCVTTNERGNRGLRWWRHGFARIKKKDEESTNYANEREMV